MANLYSWKEVLKEQEEIRKKISAKGLTGIELQFACSKEYERLHKNDEKFKEISQRIKIINEEKINYEFTKEEIEYIMFLVENSNNEIAQRISANVCDNKKG